MDVSQRQLSCETMDISGSIDPDREAAKVPEGLTAAFITDDLCVGIREAGNLNHHVVLRRPESGWRCWVRWQREHRSRGRIRLVIGILPAFHADTGRTTRPTLPRYVPNRKDVRIRGGATLVRDDAVSHVKTSHTGKMVIGAYANSKD